MFFKKNKKLNVLVLGSKGMLGKELMETLESNSKDKSGLINTVHGLDLPEVDFSSNSDHRFSYYLNSSVHYDYVINCAAITDTKGIEGKFKDLSYAVNARFLETLSGLCRTYKMKLIHISTDYVFSENTVPGRTAGHLTCESPFPVNTYGMHKLLGEKFIQENLPEKQYCIMRVSWLYGKHNRKSFVHKFLKNCMNTKADEFGEIHVNCTSDEYSVPTSCTSVCGEILDVMKCGLYGIRHSCDNFNCFPVSRFDFANKILDAFNVAYETRFDHKHPTLSNVIVHSVPMADSGVMRYPKFSVLQPTIDDNPKVKHVRFNWVSTLRMFVDDNINDLLDFLTPDIPNMKCYNVTCVDENGTEYSVGVMTYSKENAMLCAEKSLLEGRHIRAIAKDAIEADGI